MLAGPRFDPRSELTGMLGDPEALDCIAYHPVADALSARKEETLLTELIRKMDMDAAKGLWAALVVAPTRLGDAHRRVWLTGGRRSRSCRRRTA